jgi:hypothetical protein
MIGSAERRGKAKAELDENSERKHKSRRNNPGRSISNWSLHAPAPLIVNSWSGARINSR